MILVLRLLWSDLLRQLVQIFKYSLLLKKVSGKSAIMDWSGKYITMFI